MTPYSPVATFSQCFFQIAKLLSLTNRELFPELRIGRRPPTHSFLISAEQSLILVGIKIQDFKKTYQKYAEIKLWARKTFLFYTLKVFSPQNIVNNSSSI